MLNIIYFTTQYITVTNTKYSILNTCNYFTCNYNRKYQISNTSLTINALLSILFLRELDLY